MKQKHTVNFYVQEYSHTTKVKVEVWRAGEYLIMGYIEKGRDLEKFQHELYKAIAHSQTLGFDNTGCYPNISPMLGYNVWFYVFP